MVPPTMRSDANIDPGVEVSSAARFVGATVAEGSSLSSAVRVGDAVALGDAERDPLGVADGLVGASVGPFGVIGCGVG